VQLWVLIEGCHASNVLQPGSHKCCEEACYLSGGQGWLQQER
jgi:hypothetical protein